MKQSLHQDVFEASSAVEDTVDFYSLLSSDPVDDSPRGLLNFAPCSISNGAQLRGHTAALWQDLKRFAAGNDAVEDLPGAKRYLVQKVGSQTLDIARGDLRPDDGVSSFAHGLAAFPSAALARRRTSAVE